MKRLYEILTDEITHELGESSDVRLELSDHATFTLKCFSLANKREQNPHLLATELAKSLRVPNSVRLHAQGGYLNFTVDPYVLSLETLGELHNTQQPGESLMGADQTIVLDYSAPNIGKPLHVGHIRSTILGDSLKRLFEHTGHNVHSINYIGDSGTHLAKILAQHQQTPANLSDEKELLALYVAASQNESESFQSEVADMRLAIQQGDAAVLHSLAKIEQTSLASFQRVYDALDISFDETAGQKQYSELGSHLIQNLTHNNVLDMNDDGAYTMRLHEYNLADKVFLRSDKSAIYSTQDAAAAIHRHQKYGFDNMLYVVASEQELYFKQLFASLDKMGYSWADSLEHINFGMMHLPEGKLSSRAGTVVFLEDVIDESIQSAKDMLTQVDVHADNKEELAHMIGVGALKYSVLQKNYQTDILFDSKQALDISASSAPYIQYTHARANALATRDDSMIGASFDTPQEQKLIYDLATFPFIVSQATTKRYPHLIAEYADSLARDFNSLYASTQIMNTNQEGARKHLCYEVARTLDASMGLLGINVPERM